MSDYTTREMLEAIELRNPMKTFFANKFFSVHHTHIAEIIEVDVRKGKRKMAPFVAPRKGGKVITREGFKTNTFRTPKIAPERIMTIDDISKRGLGENLYSRKTPEERADELMARDFSELEKSIVDRIEWMVRQILFYGKIDVTDISAGIDIQIDFGFENKYILDDSVLWSVSSINPIDDLKQWRRDVIKKTGTAPNVCFMGSEVSDIFMKNNFIIKAMDTLNLKNIVIEPRVVDPALTYLGRIAELDLDIYSYDEWFVNDKGEEESIIPYGNILLANTDGIGSIEYGAVTQMENGNYITYEAEIVPKQWSKDEDNIKMLRLTSRPIPFPLMFRPGRLVLLLRRINMYTAKFNIKSSVKTYRKGETLGKEFKEESLKRLMKIGAVFKNGEESIKEFPLMNQIS